MELHSYAKRRISKKWTIEQKRKLVEARIAHDAWFINKPSSVLPWKNILIAANLADFNVFFVRKQWSNMLARYKQYKQTRLGNIASKAIDAELIKRINQEWEFFEPIHLFMTRKTTNLHSYALTHRTDIGDEYPEAGEDIVQPSTVMEAEKQARKISPIKLHNDTTTLNLQKDCVKENIPNNITIVMQPNTTSNNDDIHLFSSDTNEEFQVLAAETTRIIKSAKRETLEDEDDEHMNCVRNTDHDFYSKKSTLEDIGTNKRRHEDDSHEQQSNYFADASEESQTSSNMVVDLIQPTTQADNVATSINVMTEHNDQCLKIKSENVTPTEIIDLKEETHDDRILHYIPSTSTQSNQTSNFENIPTSTTTNRLSERDKYYRHKRRFNRRLENRFDALLQVMGQIVKVEYPNVDITPLLGAVTTATSNICKLLSSDSEDDNQSDVNDNIPTTTKKNR